MGEKHERPVCWWNGVNYLRQQVRDLLLLFSALIRLDGELLGEIRDLHVCLGEVLHRLVDQFLLLFFHLERLFRELINIHLIYMTRNGVNVRELEPRAQLAIWRPTIQPV